MRSRADRGVKHSAEDAIAPALEFISDNGGSAGCLPSEIGRAINVPWQIARNACEAAFKRGLLDRSLEFVKKTGFGRWRYWLKGAKPQREDRHEQRLGVQLYRSGAALCDNAAYRQAAARQRLMMERAGGEAKHLIACVASEPVVPFDEEMTDGWEDA